MMSLERVGESFQLEMYLEARVLTKKLVRDYATKIQIGMSEEEIKKELNLLFQKQGLEKYWHPTKVRIGRNTIKSFKEISESSIFLKGDDIFFIDMGPVFNQHEADYGETFVLGNNPDYLRIQKSVKEIFDDVSLYWKKHRCSGQKLYQYAEEITQKKGYLFHPKMKGHRLGDFPHALVYRGSLEEAPFIKKGLLWVLEILIQDSSQQFGAFYEDIIDE